MHWYEVVVVLAVSFFATCWAQQPVTLYQSSVLAFGMLAKGAAWYKEEEEDAISWWVLPDGEALLDCTSDQLNTFYCSLGDLEEEEEDSQTMGVVQLDSYTLQKTGFIDTSPFVLGNLVFRNNNNKGHQSILAMGRLAHTAMNGTSSFFFQLDVDKMIVQGNALPSGIPLSNFRGGFWDDASSNYFAMTARSVVQIDPSASSNSSSLVVGQAVFPNKCTYKTCSVLPDSLLPATSDQFAWIATVNALTDRFATAVVWVAK